MRSPGPACLVTKEARRFAEFCDACRRDRSVGRCSGPPGVGQTRSARHDARWAELEPLMVRWQGAVETDVPSRLQACRTVVSTPTVMSTPRRLTDARTTRCRVCEAVVATAADPAREGFPPHAVELVIVDEADRLKEPTLEQRRDPSDRTNQRRGLGPIGLPGIEQRLARDAQRSSRVGFVHHFRPLSEEELGFILAHTWAELGLSFAPDDYTDAEALAASSPAATSGWCSGCSARSAASWRSISCAPFPRSWSKP